MSDVTLNELLNTAKTLRIEKRDLETSVKALGRALEDIKLQIQTKMLTEGIDKTTAEGITVSLSDATVYNIADYELFHGFVLKEGHTGLFQRRVSNEYVKSLLTDPILGLTSIPGLVPFEKQKVNLRVD